MEFKPIIVVAGEPNSVFLEIFFKSLNSKHFKSPIILIASENVLKVQIKKFKFKFKYKIYNLDLKNIELNKIKKNQINLINVKFQYSNFSKIISSKSNSYINNCFKVALDLIKKEISNKLINGPISKKYFLKKKYLGITEYLSEKTNSKNTAMLIYNKNLSVSPITTHLPIKLISKNIKKKVIISKIKLLCNFYKNHLKKTPNIAVTGLNPHCESILKFNEDTKIVNTSVKILQKKGFKISGPYSADTLFIKNNRKKYDVIVGMYHDQVLTPIKTIYEYDAINITLGLPFIRISPDHGPNENMIGKNSSNPLSLIRALEFLDY